MPAAPQYQLEDFGGAGVYGRLPGVPPAPSAPPEYPPTSTGSAGTALQDLGLLSSGARIAANTGVFGTAGQTVKGVTGDIGNIAGIYTGLEHGGAGGDLSAGANAAQLLSRSNLGEVSSIAGDVAGPLGVASSVYNFAENWRSGATGSDALQGAEAGAAIGTAVLPVFGTVVGGVIGGAVGALSSAFGGGATDPETHNWQGFINATNGANATPAQVDAAAKGMPPQVAFNLLTGVMDIKDGRIPFVNAFGRMGESEVLNQMTGEINNAISAGKIHPNATPDEIYSQVVEPWLNSKGATITPETGGLQLQAVLKSLIGSWQSGQLTSATPLDSGGQTDRTLPQYAGHTLTPTSTPGALTGQLSSGSTAANPLPEAIGAAGLIVGGLASGGVNSPPGTSMPVVPQSSNPALQDPNTLAAAGATGSLPMSNTQQIVPDSSTGGGGLSPLETSGLLTGVGLLGTGYAQHQSDSVISPITQTGAPFVGAGQSLLSQFQNQTLTPAQQQVVNTSQSQGKTLINAATPIGQAAQTLYTEFASGKLNAGDQAALDQQVTAAKAQIAQSLGPNVDSTTLQTYYDQIDQQALITKQTMLNNYMTTGNQAFDTWAQTTEAGQQTILQGQEYAVNQIDQTFSQALEATNLGGNDILAGIQATLQSNKDLASAFSSYMGNIAKGYAQSVAGGASSAASAIGKASGFGSPQAGPSGQDQINTDTGIQAQADASAGNEWQNTTGNMDLPSVNMPGDSSIMDQISPSFADAAPTESFGGYY